MDREFIHSEIKLLQGDYRAGKLDLASSRLSKLYRRFPEHPEVLMAKGMIHFAKGEREKALESFNRTLQADPDAPEALGWAAYVSLNLERFAEAESMAWRLTELAPQNARGHYLLSAALRALGRIGEALAAIDRALELKPDDADCLVAKARLLQAWQMPALAGELYRKAMAIRPTPAAGMEMARVLMRDGHMKAALDVFRQIEPMLPISERPHGPMAQALTHLRRFDEAAKKWSLAEKYSRKPTAIRHSRALAEISVGRFDVAEEILLAMIGKDEDLATTFTILASGRKVTPDDLALIGRIETLSGNGSVGPAQRSDLHYSLGKSFDDLRDFERAIFHYDEANRICYDLYRSARSFDRERTRALANFLIETTSDQNLKKFRSRGLETSLPLFVVGMMRSGTTLTESILSAHTKVKGGGEQGFWTERVIEFVRFNESQLEYDHDLVLRFARAYTELIDPNDSQIQYVVDKNPGNIEIAGILNAALPKSKIVHLKRHPVDNLLSLWMTPLSENVRYASSRANLVFTYREYLRLWKHWQNVLPVERFATFRYEDLTSEPVNTIGNMLGFLGLESEEACFHPEKNVRSVLTPSVYQVRQPINTASQARWKNYEPWLGEFAELLDEAEP